MKLLLPSLCLLAMVVLTEQCLICATPGTVATTVAATTVAATTVAGRKRRGAVINTATTTLTKSELEQEERLAFTLCDSDRMAGLTWEEVLNCEVGRRWLASEHTFFIHKHSLLAYCSVGVVVLMSGTPYSCMYIRI